MSYKTVLAYLSGPESSQSVLGAALNLAEAHNAHVIGLHVLPNLAVYAGSGLQAYPEILTRQREEDKRRAEETRQLFEELCSRTVVAYEWRCADAKWSNLESVVSEHIRCADLVVALRGGESFLEAYDDLSTDIVLSSGRPVVLVSESGWQDEIGSKVLVAWNGSREAARAAFDALPILKMAKQVYVLSINPPKDDRENMLSTSDDIALALARHDVPVEAMTDVAPNIRVADEILSRVSDLGCNLVVMGCYGHSRLRETVFGGVTREIMNSATVPVLMSH